MAAKEKIGFAVVGLGSIAKSSVLPAFARCKRAKLVAVIGRDRKSAEPLARRFNAKVVAGSGEFAEAISDPAIKAVYIATPQDSHLQFTTAAAKAGKHVLCEKPLAVTVEQAEKMVQICKAHNVLLMTAYRKYFEPSALYVKKLIHDGAFGRLDTIHTSFSELHVPNQSLDWLLDARIAGGGPLMDLGVYCVNTTRWLAGEDPLEATAQEWCNDKSRFREVEEGISFRLRFPSGLIVHGSSSYGAALSSFIFIQGTKGWVSLAPAFPFDEVRTLTGKIGGKWLEKRFPVIDEFALEMEAFAAAIQENQSIEPDGAQGLRDLQIIQAIYTAAKKQKSVSIQNG